VPRQAQSPTENNARADSVPAQQTPPSRPEVTVPAQPAEAKHFPPAPKTVLPLGGGRLLHPGSPGLFAHNDCDDLMQIVQPADTTSPSGCI
jgi:hypothetical protein